MQRRRGAFALVLLCSMVAVACGSSEPIAARATVPALTKASYIEQANAICTGMNDAVDAMGDPPDDNPATMVQYLDRWVAILNDTLGDLRALPAPTGDEATLRAVYTKVDTLLADGIALGDAIKAGNSDLFDQLNAKLSASADTANAASLAYGLTVCGED